MVVVETLISTSELGMMLMEVFDSNDSNDSNDANDANGGV